MSWVISGFPSPLPLDIDFYLLSNEDIGFIASLVTGTNDVEAFALPYPATIDLFDETIVVWAIDFIIQATLALNSAVTTQGLMVHLSMLDVEFSASWFGNLTDADDEALKAQFAGPLYFGQTQTTVTATASVEGSERHPDGQQMNRYYPPVAMRLVTPLYIQFTTQSQTITLATNVVAELNFTTFERVALRVWFTRSPLTSFEKGFRMMQVRFQRLDA